VDILKTLSVALTDADRDRERSQQKELGASQVGGCRAQAWHFLNDSPKVNHETESLAAIMGTAIHNAIAEALTKYDTFGDFIIEGEFQDEFFKGHVDFYSKSAETVYDWKTVTLAKIAKGGLPTKQQKIQVNIYASLIAQSHPVKKVGLVFIPRDGKMNDIVYWEDDYNPQLVEEAKAWVSEIKSMTEAPAPERSAAYFCQSYCSYWGDVCPGK